MRKSVGVHFVYGVGFLLFLVLFAACNNPSNMPQQPIENSAVYLAADQDQMIMINWQKGSENEVQGEWITWKMPDLKFFSSSEPVKMLWSGQIQDETTMTMTVSGSLIQGKVEQNRLNLTGTSAEGTFQQATWYRVTQEQANLYTAAFEAYGQARLAFAALRWTMGSLPTDSKEEWYAASVGSAERYVNQLGEKRDQLKELEKMCGTGLLADFWWRYPPISSQFVLSAHEQEGVSASENADHVVKETTVWKELEVYEQAWVAAEQQEVPGVEGISLDWQVNPEELSWPEENEEQQEVVEKARTLLKNLEEVLVVDFESMKTLESEAEQIGTEVEDLAQAQGCPRP